MDIEDIFEHENQPPRKNSKKKGSRGELSLAKLLSAHFKKPFSRCIGSGMNAHRSNLTEEAKRFYSGDLVCPPGFLFCIESKSGYDDIDPVALLIGSTRFDAFLTQAKKDGERVGRHPMLCWHRDRTPWLTAVPKLVLKKKFDVMLNYYSWVVLPLAELLKMPDEFFFEK